MIDSVLAGGTKEREGSVLRWFGRWFCKLGREGGMEGGGDVGGNPQDRCRVDIRLGGCKMKGRLQWMKHGRWFEKMDGVCRKV